MLKKGKLLIILSFTLVFTVYFTLPINAQPNSGYLDYREPEQVSQPNLFWELIKVILALAFVLAVAYLIFQFLSKRNPLLARGEFINIIESSYLAPNRSISIVEAGNKLLILGATEQQINLLTEITDPQMITLLKERGQGNDGQGSEDSFANHLAGFLGKLNSLGNLKTPKENSIDDKQLNNLQEYFARQVEEIKVFSVNNSKKATKNEHSREKDEG